MDWKYYLDNQEKLDNHIEDKHPREEGENRLLKKVVALQVELGELVNNVPQIMKFWKVDPQMKREEALKEYVDVIHFGSSVGLELGYDVDNHQFKTVVSTGALEIVHDIFTFTSWIRDEKDTFGMFPSLLNHIEALGKVLGFTEAEVKAAYDEKNKLNFARQAENY